MTRVAVFVLVCAALIAAGCGQRTPADLREEMTRLSEDLARVMASSDAPAAKLKQAEKIAARMKELAVEAKKLQEAWGDEAASWTASQLERQQKAAEELRRAVEKTGGQ